MISIMKSIRFDAAHYLPDYDGVCKRVHGHTYQLDVYVTRNNGWLIQDGPKKGMVMDFKDLKQVLNSVVMDVCDHRNLNEVFEYPTAERMVLALASQIQKELGEDYKVTKLVLWEKIGEACAIWESTDEFGLMDWRNFKYNEEENNEREQRRSWWK